MTTYPQRQIAVIGGAAAYDLARAGQHVTLIDNAPVLGGLASSLQLKGETVEYFYHFICRSDRYLVDLVKELGLGDQLHWQHTQTSFYHDGRLYAFGTPIDLLRFSAVPFTQRLRFGLHILRSRFRSNWRWLDEFPAKAWLIENIGEEAYNVIWHPLLRIKFGTYYDQISAAWIWHRIWRVARSRQQLWGRESFGYLTHGSATLVERLVQWLQAQPNVTLRIGERVKTIEVQDETVRAVVLETDRVACDAVLSTVALPVLDRLVPAQTSTYFEKIRQVKYIGVVCALFNLKRSFSPNFWLNINDPRISFNGIIEQTNLNQNLRDAGLNLIYVPYYLPTDEPRYSYSDEQLYAEYLVMLKLVNPAFDESWIQDRFISRAAYAQAVCTTRFADLRPDHRAPLRGLYVTDSTQFYPEDRTLSAAIEQGHKAAAYCLEDGAER